jgi:plasmid stability protein
MPDLTIRDLPREELDALARRARRHGRSAEDEARHLLHEAAAEEMLVEDLERATRAADATLAAVRDAPTPATSARRRTRYEPTPRRG